MDVLDRQMPVLDGDGVLERLGYTAFDGHVVSAREEDARLCADDVSAYLTKPIQPDGFVA